jgi:hypothetical protein
MEPFILLRGFTVVCWWSSPKPVRWGAPIGVPFSVWWKERTARPTGYDDDGIARLEAVLSSAAVCDSTRFGYIDGERRMTVAYALFDFGPGPGSYPSAAHEAAHAVVAWRLHVPLHGIGLAPDSELRGGFACNLGISARPTLGSRDLRARLRDCVCGGYPRFSR